MYQLNEKVFVAGEHDKKTLDQIVRCAQDDRVIKAALCADGHLGYAVPIGGVIAYKDAISPSGVGFDIGCGNKYVSTDIPATYTRANVKEIMDQVVKSISFGIGRNNEEHVSEKYFSSFENHSGWLTDAGKQPGLRQKAENQLGTVGSGNHYVDLFENEYGMTGVGVHFGSRGLGHTIASWFLKAAGAKDGMEVEPCVLDVLSDLGLQYIEAMELGGLYAYAGRDWVCDKVVSILHGNITDFVHNHHNYAWKESHIINGESQDLWVVRKGATPAFPGQEGFIGSTMAEESVIVRGSILLKFSTTNDLQESLLFSTVHGAGRIMGRMEAKGKPAKPARFGQIQNNGKKQEIPATEGRAGKVTRDMMDYAVAEAGIELRGADLDESPHCYKRLTEVLDHMAGTIEVIDTLKPIAVAMAGSDVRDPYKD